MTDDVDDRFDSSPDWGADAHGNPHDGGHPHDPLHGAEPGPHSSHSSTDPTTMAAIAHIVALVGGVIGATLVYVIVEEPYVEENAANAVNYPTLLVHGVCRSLLEGGACP